MRPNFVYSKPPTGTAFRVCASSTESVSISLNKIRVEAVPGSRREGRGKGQNQRVNRSSFTSAQSTSIGIGNVPIPRPRPRHEQPSGPAHEVSALDLAIVGGEHAFEQQLGASYARLNRKCVEQDMRLCSDASGGGGKVLEAMSGAPSCFFPTRDGRREGSGVFQGCKSQFGTHSGRGGSRSSLLTMFNVRR